MGGWGGGGGQRVEVGKEMPVLKMPEIRHPFCPVTRPVRQTLLNVSMVLGQNKANKTLKTKRHTWHPGGAFHLG